MAPITSQAVASAASHRSGPIRSPMHVASVELDESYEPTLTLAIGKGAENIIMERDVRRFTADAIHVHEFRGNTHFVSGTPPFIEDVYTALFRSVVRALMDESVRYNAGFVGCSALVVPMTARWSSCTLGGNGGLACVRLTVRDREAPLVSIQLMSSDEPAAGVLIDQFEDGPRALDIIRLGDAVTALGEHRRHLRDPAFAVATW